MAFHSQYNYVLEGPTVGFRRSVSRTFAALPRGRVVDLPAFIAVDGKLGISIDALHFQNPTRTRLVGPVQDPRQGGGRTEIEEFQHIPFLVELFAPRQRTPVASWRTEEGWTRNEFATFEHRVGPQGSPAGSWKCRITNKGTATARVNVGVSSFFDREPLQTTALPVFLVDHAYQLLLEALIPSAEVAGGKLKVTFGKELLEYFGPTPPAALGTTEISLGGWRGTGRTLDFAVDATSSEALLTAMRDRHQDVRDRIDKDLRNARDFLATQRLNAERKKNDEWRAAWEQRVPAGFATVHASVACTDIHLSTEILDYGYGKWDLDADISNVFVDLYLAFDPGMQHCHALVLSTATITGGEADYFEGLGFIPDANEFLEKKLPDPIQAAAAPLARYLAEGLARLCAHDAVFFRLTADRNTWRVQHTAPPAESVRPGIPRPRVTEAPGEIDPRGGGTPEPLGVIPDTFAIAARDGETAAETLGRLDRINTIVVVMMENRSFDHMLGYLRNSRPEVEGLRGTEYNEAVGRTVKVLPAREVVSPATKIPHSPHHGWDHVPRQIADGAMSGFAQDFEERHPGEAEYVMAYYTGDELPSYHALASEYTVCDHWFAAHPGGTWPNRWITLSGTTPDLRNLEVDDERLGFVRNATIFDVLDAYGIDWRMFESDLSVIRTFNRYRLDTQHVVPRKNRHDDSRSLATLAANADLPPVVFIEPNFRDLPPLSTANDDLAPVDLRRGQDFIAEIYNTLVESDQFARMLFVITYDEHGGFYDHLAPPGTKLGPPEWYDVAAQRGLVPPAYKPDRPPKPGDAPVDPPRYLGVRVPAFVISPYASKGGLSKAVFDHSSIIKTILLRHRARFPQGVFRQFGPRVEAAGHLGLALDLDAPRTDRPKLARVPRRSAQPRRAAPRAPRRAPVTPPVAAVDSDNFHESLLTAFLPRRR